MRDLGELLASGGARLGLKIGGVALAVVVLGLAAWLWLRAEDARGVAALAASADLVQQADGPQATPDARAGDYGAARGAYQIALAKGAAGSLRTLAASGVGYTWEAQKDYANAVTAYEAVARAVPAKQFYFEDALLDLARAQALAGKPVEALATYERVLKDVLDTRRAPDIRAKIAELQGRGK